jgi:EAL domain-containing protein (putative c-di-GMP-specific phosphodiesterase class I)
MDRSIKFLEKQFHSSHTAYILLDNKCHIIYGNRAAEKHALNIYGRRLILGDSIFDYCLPDEQDMLKKHIVQCKTGQSIHFHKSVESFKRQTLWHSYEIMPIHAEATEDGAILKIHELANGLQTSTTHSAKSSFNDYVKHNLCHAIAEEHISLMFQPIVNMDQKDIEGYEALIRWQDPKLGAISPQRFIPIAEKNGMIHLITRYVLTTVIDLLVTQESFFKDKYISVNISITDLMDQQLLNFIKDAIRQHKHLAIQLELEITESFFIENFEHFKEEIDQLRALGLRIAIDDFGTGFSTLDKLISLKFDRLKIDRKFVRHCLHSYEDQVILDALVDISKKLSLAVTAEGVENKKQLEKMLSIGIDTIQGYYFSKPKPFNVLVEESSLLHIRNY